MNYWKEQERSKGSRAAGQRGPAPAPKPKPKPQVKEVMRSIQRMPAPASWDISEGERKKQIKAKREWQIKNFPAPKKGRP